MCIFLFVIVPGTLGVLAARKTEVFSLLLTYRLRSIGSFHSS